MISLTKFVEAGQIQAIAITVDTRSVNQWMIYALDSPIPTTPITNADAHYTITLYTLFSQLRSRLCLGIYPASRYGVYTLGCIGHGIKFTIYSTCQEAALVLRELMKVASNLGAHYTMYSVLCKHVSVAPSRENFEAAVVDIAPRFSSVDVAVVYSRTQSQLQNIISEMTSSYHTDVMVPSVPKPIIEPPVETTKSPFIKLHTPGGLSGLVLVLYTEHMFPEPVVYHSGFMWLRKKQLKRIATYTDEKTVTDSLHKVFKLGDDVGHQALVYIGVTRGVLSAGDIKGVPMTKLSDYVAMVIKHVNVYRDTLHKPKSASTPNVILSSLSKKKQSQ